jgi:hypothetical protein
MYTRLQLGKTVKLAKENAVFGVLCGFLATIHIAP